MLMSYNMRLKSAFWKFPIKKLKVYGLALVPGRFFSKKREGVFACMCSAAENENMAWY